VPRPHNALLPLRTFPAAEEKLLNLSARHASDTGQSSPKTVDWARFPRERSNHLANSLSVAKLIDVKSAISEQDR
jgi:hypothetical protein